VCYHDNSCGDEKRKKHKADLATVLTLPISQIGSETQGWNSDKFSARVEVLTGRLAKYLVAASRESWEL
jgi:hypothetical protein